MCAGGSEPEHSRGHRGLEQSGFRSENRYLEVRYCEDVGDVRACLRKLKMEFGLRIEFGNGSLAIN